MRYHLIIFAGLLGTLSGCESQTPAVAVTVASPTLEGMILAGSPADAKASGFTSCEGDYYRWSCVKPNPGELMGVPVKRIGVFLGWDSSDTDHDLANSRYEAISAEFETPTIDYDCASEGGNFSCAADQSLPLVQLEKKLIADGWTAIKRRRGGSAYFKVGVPYSITAYSDINSAYRPNTEVQFFVTSADEIAAEVERVRAETITRQIAAQQATDFIKSMSQ